jgi:hypothetical protein
MSLTLNIIYLLLIVLSVVYNLLRIFIDTALLLYTGFILPLLIFIGPFIILFVTVFKSKKYKTVLFFTSIIFCVISLSTTKLQKDLGKIIYFFSHKNEYVNYTDVLLSKKSINQLGYYSVNNVDLLTVVDTTTSVAENIVLIKKRVLDSQNIKESDYYTLQSMLRNSDMDGFIVKENFINFHKNIIIHKRFGFIYTLNNEPPKIDESDELVVRLTKIPFEDNWYTYSADQKFFIFE